MSPEIIAKNAIEMVKEATTANDPLDKLADLMIEYFETNCLNEEDAELLVAAIVLLL